LLDPDCVYQTTDLASYFIADIEHFTLLIDHTVYAPTVGIQENAKSLPGSMKFSNGSTMHLNGPIDFIGQKGEPDIVQLSTLLLAAGINSLDDESLVNASSTMRNDGIVLMIFIEYSNTNTYNLNDLSYSYEPYIITNTKFKSVEPLLGDNSRQIINRHGIRMIFIQDGLLGKFDVQVMLLTFVTGLGLLTVSTVIVDVIALYLLPQKKVYNEYKFKVTEGPSWDMHISSPRKINEPKPDVSQPLLEDHSG
jgi:hypothetical protein